MIAFVRSVTSAGIRAGSMLRSPSRTSQKTGVAPQCSITFAVAGHVIGLVITSSPGPTPTASSARWSAAVPDVDGEHVLGLEVGGHALLEQRGPRPGRQPARAQRLDDGGDLLLPDRGRLEAELGATRGSHRPGSVRPAPHGEPGPAASSRSSPGGQDRTGPVGAAAERPEAPAGLPVGPHPLDALDRLGLVDPLRRAQHALRRDEEEDARAAHLPACRRTRRNPCDTLSPRICAEGERDGEVVEVDADRRPAELGVVAAAEPGRDLDDVRPAAGAEPDLGVARPVLDPERGDGSPGRLDHRVRSDARSARRGRARRRRRAARRGSCRSRSAGRTRRRTRPRSPSAPGRRSAPRRARRRRGTRPPPSRRRPRARTARGRA